MKQSSLCPGIPNLTYDMSDDEAEIDLAQVVSMYCPSVDVVKPETTTLAFNR